MSLEKGRSGSSVTRRSGSRTSSGSGSIATIQRLVTSAAGMRPSRSGLSFPRKVVISSSGLQSGLHRFDAEQRRFELLVEVEPDRPTNRLNDGVVDPQGRLWFGTMDNGERAKTGSFYCYSGGKLSRTNVTGISITNGPCVSPDGKTLYWVDTLGGTMSACEIGDDGELGSSRLVVKIDPKEGHPDGPDGRQRGLHLDQSLCRLGSTALFARRRALAARFFPRRQHHEDCVRRHRPADRLRDYCAAIPEAGAT